MTKMKFCGLTRAVDIEAVNAIEPDYIGFVFVEGKRRYIAPEKAKELKQLLKSSIKAVGVFLNEKPEIIAQLLDEDIIDIAQLHGDEDEAYIQSLRQLTAKPIFKAFKVQSQTDLPQIEKCSADYVLLDSGTGTGQTFDWQLVQNIKRPYFLAGGLNLENIEDALEKLQPFAVDLSSGLETEGFKDKEKMAAFAALVRKNERKSNHD